MRDRAYITCITAIITPLSTLVSISTTIAIVKQLGGCQGLAGTLLRANSCAKEGYLFTLQTTSRVQDSGSRFIPSIITMSSTKTIIAGIKFLLLLSLPSLS